MSLHPFVSSIPCKEGFAFLRRDSKGLSSQTDLTLGSTPVLFLLDELLSGTNSHDRFEGTRLVVRTLIGRGAIGIVSTHDLALTKIPEKNWEPPRLTSTSKTNSLIRRICSSITS